MASNKTGIGDGFNKNVFAAILVASLGYFVDIYDLILFSIVRIPSLKELGLADHELLDKGLLLLNVQMTGMILGGIVFGILGDKVGRLSILFASIFLYSVANLLNGFIHSIDQYLILRFFAGFGLAGELGAGITLVSELLPANKRGYGTTFVATIGVSGALWAWFVAERFNWHGAYVMGGVMGLLLLFLRLGVRESSLFSEVKERPAIRRGHFLSLFSTMKQFKKFLACVAIGVPIWYVIGILITLSPEFAKELGVLGEIKAGDAVFYCYSGLVVGDFLSGVMSQMLRSRRQSVLIFLVATSIGTIIYFSFRNLSTSGFYLLCFYLGVSVGYWAMLITVAAEQFGTNIRATVATCVPNFVRGSLVPASILFQYCKPKIGLNESGIFVATLVFIFAFWGLGTLKESFSIDLNFNEE